MVKNLKRLREEKGITQKQLALTLGISQQAINKYENERAEPDVKNLIILAEYFNTSIDYLVGYSDVNHKVEELTEYSMSNSEIKVMEGYRSLESSNKALVTSTIEALSSKVSD